MAFLPYALLSLSKNDEAISAVGLDLAVLYGLFAINCQCGRCLSIQVD